MDPLWASLRRDFRTRSIGGSGAGGAIWVFARDTLDSDRGDAGRGSAGFRGSILFDAARWQVAERNGQDGVEHDRGDDRTGGNFGDYDHSAFGAGAGGSSCAGRKPMGGVY